MCKGRGGGRGGGGNDVGVGVERESIPNATLSPPVGLLHYLGRAVVKRFFIYCEGQYRNNNNHNGNL